MFLTPLINADRIKRTIYRLFKFRNKLSPSLGNAGYTSSRRLELLSTCTDCCVRVWWWCVRCGVCQADPAHSPYLSGSRSLSNNSRERMPDCRD